MAPVMGVAVAASGRDGSGIGNDLPSEEPNGPTGQADSAADAGRHHPGDHEVSLERRHREGSAWRAVRSASRCSRCSLPSVPPPRGWGGHVSQTQWAAGGG